MYKDLTTNSQRIGWFKSRFDGVTLLDSVTVVVVLFAISVMVANIAYHYGLRIQ